MIDRPITWRLKNDEGKEIADPHILWINNAEFANPRTEFFNPCVVIANESGYYRLPKVSWTREVAQKLADQYNREVMGLTRGQVEAILTSSMFGVRYPHNYETNDAYKQLDTQGWESA